jgi:Secretion system C-terminal sorting domain
VFLLSIFAYLVLSSRSQGPGANGAGARTNAPGEGICSDCHAGGVFLPVISVQLLDSTGVIPVTNYTGGRTYTLRVSVSATGAGLAGYGAQTTVLQSSNNFVAGVLTNPSANARILILNARQYLEHNAPAPAAAGAGVWTATWVAPAIGTGSIRIFSSALAADGNGGILGDNVINGSLLVPEVAPTTIQYPKDSFCLVDIQPVPIITGVQGGVFSSSPAGLSFINISSGQIDPDLSLPGRYAVRYTYNTPPSVVTDTIIIVQQDQAIFRYIDTICQNYLSTRPIISGTRGGVFSCLDNDLILNSSTGEINLATSIHGVYSVVYTTPNTCADTQSFNLDIIYTPTATITYPSLSYCGGDNLTPAPTVFTLDSIARQGIFTVDSANRVFIDRSSGIINLDFSRPGEYNVIYTTTVTCPTSTTFAITIERPSIGIVTYSDTSYCENEPNQGVSIIGGQNGLFFSPTGAVVNRTTGEWNIQDSPTGRHVIGYIPISNCSDTSYADTININPKIDISYEYPSVGYCIAQSSAEPLFVNNITNANAYFYINQAAPIDTILANLIDPVSGVFNISTALSAGLSSEIFTIIRRDTTLCGNSDTSQLILYAAGNANFFYPNDTLCNNVIALAPPYVSGVAGTVGNRGTFSMTPNPNAINDSTGVINPFQLDFNNQNYTVIYNSPAPCSARDSVTFKTVEADSVSFNYTDYPLCIDGFGQPTITSNNGAVSGQFSARPLDTFARNPLLFLNNSTGQINLSFIFYQANILIPNGQMLGKYEIAYETFGSCPIILYDTIELSTCLATNETVANANLFLLYPNPTQEFVFIQQANFNGDLRIKLYNSLGQLLTQKDVYFQQRTYLDLSARLEGVYLIELSNSQGHISTHKIIKH